MMQTPYIVIDEQQVKNNILDMAQYAKENKIRLRPHCKTHKMPHFARMQMESGASGITVAKPSEAAVMAEQGIQDIFIAYPIVTRDKAEMVKKLNRSIKHLIVSIDSIQSAALLDGFCEGEEKRLQVRIEVETGLNRTGASISDVADIADFILAHTKHLELEGIYTFKGAVLGGISTLDIKQAGIEEGTVMLELGKVLKGKGIDLQTISIGSTPTAKTVLTEGDHSEIRPGTYIFYDAMQAKLGVCRLEQCAAVVVATVVGKYDGHLVIDGGSKTFATDVQPQQHPLDLEGFGIVIGHPECIFSRMNEEHGVIEFTGETNLGVGDELHIIPNHICSTINLHNHVYIKKENGKYDKMDVAARGQLY
ncbi:alanine racemase [Bacillus sp. 1P06AnD]|uniref:alanine racemase n=1 Tax=Bacillus sp. 1P06AnD TaxID=3132208 RepID=UPI00399FA02D